jgi:hypothetical protein
VSSAVLTLGGKSYQVLPLTVKAMRRLLPHLKAIDMQGGELTEAGLDGAIELVFEALRRGTPDLTREVVEAELEIDSLEETLTTIMRGSGLSKGEAKPETAPAPQSGTSTGTD